MNPAYQKSGNCHTLVENVLRVVLVEPFFQSEMDHSRYDRTRVGVVIDVRTAETGPLRVELVRELFGRDDVNTRHTTDLVVDDDVLEPVVHDGGIAHRVDHILIPPYNAGPIRH